MTVDLSILKVGDIVVRKDGEKGIILKIQNSGVIDKDSHATPLYDLVYSVTTAKPPIQGYYKITGEWYQYCSSSDDWDILEIIPQEKPMTVDLSTLKVGDIIEIDNDEYEKIYEIRPRKDKNFPYLIGTKRFNRDYSKDGKTSRVDGLRITKIIPQTIIHNVTTNNIGTLVEYNGKPPTNTEIEKIVNKERIDAKLDKLLPETDKNCDEPIVDYKGVLKQLRTEKNTLPLLPENKERYEILCRQIKFYENLQKMQNDETPPNPALQQAYDKYTEITKMMKESNKNANIDTNLIKEVLDGASTIAGITGKGDLSKKPHPRALNPDLLKETANCFRFGQKKHGVDNFRKMTPEAAGEIFDALLRHILDYMEGETHAKDSGLHHLAHADANLHMLYRIIKRSSDKEVLKVISGGDIE